MITYLVENKQPELRRLVVKYGLTPAKNITDLTNKVKYLMKKFKHEFMKDLANIHPDKDLIIWSLSSDKESPVTDSPSTTSSSTPIVIKEAISKMEKKSSACGCSGADGETTLGCNGDTECSGCASKAKKAEATSSAEGDKKSMVDVLKENMPLVIIGSLVLVGGLVFMGNKRVA